VPPQLLLLRLPSLLLWPLQCVLLHVTSPRTCGAATSASRRSVVAPDVPLSSSFSMLVHHRLG